MPRLELAVSKLSPQRVLAGLVFIPLLAYFFAPFSNIDLSFHFRLAFWAAVLALALTVTWAARRLVYGKFGADDRFIGDVVYAVLILYLFAPSLWVLAWLIFTLSGLDAPGLTSILPYGVMFATGLLLVRRHENTDADTTAQTARLCNRLPKGFQGQIYRLTGRDHYVDVATSEGVFTIRFRLADAIAEMEPVPGHCAHRSHWVTEAAINGVERQGGKLALRLCNGDLVPVSRKYQPELEASGIL